MLTNTGEQHATLEVTMSAVLKLCQERYDAQLPPEVSESDELKTGLSIRQNSWCVA